MVSELVFFLSYLVLLPIAFMFPYAGALAYEWLQYMPPYNVYNASGMGSFSLIMGGLALGLWLVKDKKQLPKPVSLFAIFILYTIWVNITQLTTVVGEAGVGHWDRTYKMLLFTLALSMMAKSRARLEAFLWVICLSIGNFAVSGAIKTILSGGGGTTVVGGSANILNDSVTFSIAAASIIPFVRYLRDHATLFSRSRKRTLGLDFLTLCCVLAVIGTQRRTGLISLGVLATFYFFKSKRKFAYLAALPILVAAIFVVVPASTFERFSSISTNPTDASSQGRLASWSWGWDFALAHPITGGGFHSFVLHRYPDPNGTAFLEAHNIFIETLADHGFVGLGLFLLLIIGTTFNCQWIIGRTKKIPELAWASNLGAMLQLALWTFIAGSQFVSDATLSISFEIVALSLAARSVVERELAQRAPISVPDLMLGPSVDRPASKVAGVRADVVYGYPPPPGGGPILNPQ